MTPVITIAKAQVVHLELKVRPTLAQRVKDEVSAFVKTLRSSKLFSDELVTIWQEKFSREHGQILTTDKERENASAALCFLLCDMILPKVSEEKPEQQVMILSLEEEIKSLLKIILPEGKNVDDFIKEYEDASDEEAANQNELAIKQSLESKEDELDEEELLIGKIQEIELEFQNQISTLYTAANEENASIRKYFEDLKTRLREINQSRIEMHEKTKQRITTLMSKFSEVSKKLSTTEERSKYVAQKLTQQELEMERILKEASTFLSEH